jgi:acetylornithine deacetylase/succinyl-diaminopimelate desuccinylase-like protein
MFSPRLSALFVLFALLFPAPPAEPAAPRLSEAARWLQDYIRIDTSNPPGNEGKAVAFLAGILRKEGIAARPIPNPSGRPSLYARLSSPRSGGKALVLLHHMDVVPAGPGWKVPPFSGLVSDGMLWGRGAIDDKSLGIAQLAALIDLHRRKAPFERDLIYLAVPDEENGGLAGAAWLLQKHPELFAGVEAVMGEGGRSQMGAGGKVLFWGIEVAQKRPLWLEVTASGRGGHGSGLNPGSANHQLVQGLARVLALPPRWHVSDAARVYCKAIAPLHNERMRRTLADVDKTVTPTGPKEFLMPGMANLFLDTVQVTVLSGGSRINVIPETARARLDVRLLPDTDANAFLEQIKKALGKGIGVKVLVTSPPVAPSPAQGRFWQALEKGLGGAPVVPTFIAGFTDSRFFRERGIAAYGVNPVALSGEDSRGIHNPDERIPLEAFDRGVERTQRIVALYAAPAVR